MNRREFTKILGLFAGGAALPWRKEEEMKLGDLLAEVASGGRLKPSEIEQVRRMANETYSLSRRSNQFIDDHGALSQDAFRGQAFTDTPFEYARLEADSTFVSAGASQAISWVGMPDPMLNTGVISWSSAAPTEIHFPSSLRDKMYLIWGAIIGAGTKSLLFEVINKDGSSDSVGRLVDSGTGLVENGTWLYRFDPDDSHIVFKYSGSSGIVGAKLAIIRIS